ncbi:SPOR domain-containing protein [Georgenia sp. MJ206]|uniref:SPOR domain-containing protein n=1 Tax=Georgenia wangjunii TaxID=3117730 RepID=UPI002F266988
MTNRPEYYFNLNTRQVEEGKVSGADDRMGPYPTREAAEAALLGAEARNDQWDEEDKAWERG